MAKDLNTDRDSGMGIHSDESLYHRLDEINELKRCGHSYFGV